MQIIYKDINNMGWIANVLLILSMWLMGSKNRWAFVAGSVGNFLWIFRGLYQEKPMYDLVSIAAIMTILNIRGWFKWSCSNPYWDQMVKDARKSSGKWFWEA